MKQCVWVYTKKGGIESISREVRATILAEWYPERIYFFAQLVPDPDYDNEK